MDKFEHMKNVENLSFKFIVIRGRTLGPVEKSPPRWVEVGVGVERWVGRRRREEGANPDPKLVSSLVREVTTPPPSHSLLPLPPKLKPPPFFVFFWLKHSFS